MCCQKRGHSLATSLWRHSAVTVIVYLFTLFVALLVPEVCRVAYLHAGMLLSPPTASPPCWQLDVVFGLTGATSAVLVSYILPCLFYLRLRPEKVSPPNPTFPMLHR